MSTQSTRRAKGRKRHESSGCSRLPSAALRFRAFSSEEPAILDQVLCWVFNPFHAMTLNEAMNRAGLSMTPSQRILLCERVEAMVSDGRLIHQQVSVDSWSLPCFVLSRFSLSR